MTTASDPGPEHLRGRRRRAGGRHRRGADGAHRRRRDQARLGRQRLTADVELHTTALDQIVEHNAGDLTATLQAGVPLAVAQRTFAAAGQMLALDPPLGGVRWARFRRRPTIGGVVATGDSGPLRHRYGAPRDLVIGTTVALSDGTIAQAGGKVIKNVAGYDLAKLFSGSFGTLGLILSVNVRLHPLHETSVTALGAAADPARARRRRRGARRRSAGVRGARCRLAGRPRRAAGTLRRTGGASAGPPRRALHAGCRAQRRRRHRPGRAAVGAPARRSALAGPGAGPGGGAPHRPGCGAARRRRVRRDAGRPRRAGRELHRGRPRRRRARCGPRCRPAPRPCCSMPRRRCAPPGFSGGWRRAPSSTLMRRVKARFDPAGTCNPGLFVGGI